ncbi:hypothetical protein [Flavobacterium flavigenum]|uniref:hypothetical protein n=1 Tax=Flavobacterium flavigenum TaxID=3003258 RepID=UPI00248287D3|nr:hypothetical protein [Flavobacterium flavigenum]
MKKNLFLLFLSLVSCVKDNGNLSKNEISNYQNEIIRTGNKDAYLQLMLYYRNNQDSIYTLLPYTFIMANKYNNPDAFLELYQNLIKLNNNGIYKDSLIVNLRKQEADYALSFLKRGSELNDVDCKVFLAKHYEKGFGITKNKKIADSLINSIK